MGGMGLYGGRPGFMTFAWPIPEMRREGEGAAVEWAEYVRQGENG